MSAHAQGPWARHERLILAPYATPPNGVAILMDVMGPAMVDANAALIAAAPDLLAALIRCADAALSDDDFEAYKIARAAIKKATTPLTGEAISR